MRPRTAVGVAIDQTEIKPNGTGNITAAATTDTYGMGITVNNVYMMILTIVGLTGNILTICVLSNRRNRKVSTAILYISLAVSDLHIIILNLVFNWIWYTFNIYINAFPTVCHIIIFLQMSSMEMSAWLVAIITLERVVSVKYPFKAMAICTTKVAVAVVMCTTFMVACNNFFRVVGHGGLCNARTRSFGRFFDIYEYYKTNKMQYALPAVIIVAGNIVIHRQVKRTTLIREASSSNDRNISITRSLILVSAAFLITMTPGFVYLTLMLNDFVPYHQDVILFFILLSNTNASINFILYMLQGSRFRKEVKYLFSCCKRERNAPASTVTASTDVS